MRYILARISRIGKLILNDTSARAVVENHSRSGNVDPITVKTKDGQKFLVSSKPIKSNEIKP